MATVVVIVALVNERGLPVLPHARPSIPMGLKPSPCTPFNDPPLYRQDIPTLEVIP